jgi:hypothetical protein
MTKANPIAMRATCTALPLLAAGLLLSTPAAAQPEASEEPTAAPQPQPEPQGQPQPPTKPQPPPRPQPQPPLPMQPLPLPPPQQLPPPWPPQAQPMPRQLPRAELAVPRPVRADELEGPVTSWDPLRFAVAFESRTFWPLDGAQKRLVGKRAPTGGGLSVQADVFRPDDRVAVRLDLGWTNNSTVQTWSGTSRSENIESDLFVLGASLRYHVLRWLAPYARVSGGLGRDRLTVVDMKDRQYFGQATAGAGVFLRTPGLRLWQGSFAPFFGLCGQIEGGYALASGSDFSLQASLPSSTPDPIPTSDVALGHVGRTAPYLRVSLGLAF